MTYFHVNQRMRERAWAQDKDTVDALASAMVYVDYITDASILLDYFEKPYNWHREHDWWEENNRTDDRDLWAQGEVDGWES